MWKFGCFVLMLILPTLIQALCDVLIRRDKVMSRFERCRDQFADVSNLWLAAESSVHLLGHAATLPVGTDEESGIGPSASIHSLPPTHSPRLSEPRSSGLGSSAPVTTEAVNNSETPEVRLQRLGRLKDHLTKYILGFQPDQLDPHHQCACETDRW